MIFLDLAFGSHLCVVGGKEGRAVGTGGRGGRVEGDALPGPQILADQLFNPYSTRGKSKPTACIGTHPQPPPEFTDLPTALGKEHKVSSNDFDGETVPWLSRSQKTSQ